MVPHLVQLDLNKDESSDVKLGMISLASCWEPHVTVEAPSKSEQML